MMHLGTQRRTSLALFATWLLATAFAKGEETHTFAYVLDKLSYVQISSYRGSQGPFDPTKVERKAPENISTPPQKSRFFHDEDKLWSLTDRLREEKILTNDSSWAVWNETTARLVLHGTIAEHELFSFQWHDLNHVVKVATTVTLLQAPCKELDAVDWTEGEVKKRKAKTLSSITTHSYPGLKAHSIIGSGDLKAQLETEANCGSDYKVVDVRIHFSSQTSPAEDTRLLTLNTGITAYTGHTIYLDVGSANNNNLTYLLGIQPELQFTDGTPRTQWREHLDPNFAKEPLHHHPDKAPIRELENGLIHGTWQVPPTFATDIHPSQNDEVDDPFADTEAPSQTEKLPHPVITDPDPSWGFSPTHRVYDLSTVMRNHGIQILGDGGIFYNQTNNVVVTHLTQENTDLFEFLISHGHYHPPKMIRVVASLLEWTGPNEPGRIPDNAQRLARSGSILRPGQKSVVTHISKKQADNEGLTFEVEVNIGANDFILDLRALLSTDGPTATQLSTGLTLTNGRPLLVPVSSKDGKNRGVLFQANIMDGTGAHHRTTTEEQSK